MTALRRQNTRPVRRRRGGFTLIELMMSLAVMSIVLGAMGSVLLVSIRSIDGGTGPSAQAIAASDVMQGIAQDVNLASSFNARSAPGMTPVVLDFTVPDRNGDLAPETIRYEWSGVPGAPLTRRYNGGATVNVAEDVREFSLSYLTRFRKGAAPPPPPPPVEGPEQVLVSRDWSNAGDIKSYSLKISAWAAEYFKPTLPGNAVSWKVTRVMVKLKRNGGATGDVTVTVNNVDGSNKPIGAALGSYTIDITSVSSAAFVWIDVPLTAISGLNPGTALAIEVTTTKTSIVANLAYDQKATDTGMGWMTGSSPGTSWSTPTSTTAMECYVYGTITTQP